MIKEKGIYTSSEASLLTIYNFGLKLLSLNNSGELNAFGTELVRVLEASGNIVEAFPILSKIAENAATKPNNTNNRIRRIALALSYSEEGEEDFASKEDLEWIPRVKEGLTSYGLESIEYQTTDDATSFQEAWIFPGKKIVHPELGNLLIGVDYELEPRTAKQIPEGKVALSVFFETIVPDSYGTATKHILPLYLILVDNKRSAVRKGILKLRFRVGFWNQLTKLTERFEYIKTIKA
jgi:hypothetical protein